MDNILLPSGSVLIASDLIDACGIHKLNFLQSLVGPIVGIFNEAVTMLMLIPISNVRE